MFKVNFDYPLRNRYVFFVCKTIVILAKICYSWATARGGGGGRLERVGARLLLQEIHPCVSLFSYRGLFGLALAIFFAGAYDLIKPTLFFSSLAVTPLNR